jgi:hypothetical protein
MPRTPFSKSKLNSRTNPRLPPLRAWVEPYREAASVHVGSRIDILTISELARHVIPSF